MKRIILGCEGKKITEEEAAVFKDHSPLGLILFLRNCENPDQIRKLTDHFKELVGDDNRLIMIDEEGGSVQRMKSPVWEAHPAYCEFGKIYKKNKSEAIELLKLNCSAISAKLKEVGINTVAAPVVDVLHDNTHNFMHDRCFSHDADVVSELGGVVVDEFLKYGVLPIIKHLPGHGRASKDSHFELPRISTDSKTMDDNDFKPFKELSRCPLGLTSHILYDAIDPDNPITFSAAGVEFIRKQLGFTNLLMTDCIYMEALTGTIPEKAQKAIQAGIDIVLSCHGSADEKALVADKCGSLEGDQLRKFNSMFAMIRSVDPSLNVSDHLNLSRQINQKIKNFSD